MTTTDRAKQDLSYVAGVVRDSDHNDGLPLLNFFWAAVVAAGFALVDFAPVYAGWFWVIAAPGGAAISWWIGRRHSERRGVKDVQWERRYLYHWLIVCVASALSLLNMLLGTESPDVAVRNMLLIIGLAYALAGVHMERALLWSGLVMLGGYLALLLLPLPYIWTTTGLVVAAALIVPAFNRRGQLVGI